MKHRSLCILIAAALAVGGCVYDEHDDNDGLDDNALEDVSLSEDVQPIFTDNCVGAGCHGEGEVPPALTEGLTYDELWEMEMVEPGDPQGSVLYERMTSASRPMPPGGVLPDNQLAVVRAWIEQGAEDN